MERNSPSENEARVADHNISRHQTTQKLVNSFRESLSLQRQFNSVTFLNTLVFQDLFECYPHFYVHVSKVLCSSQVFELKPYFLQDDFTLIQLNHYVPLWRKVKIMKLLAE
jgi:hypothetical protein